MTTSNQARESVTAREALRAVLRSAARTAQLLAHRRLKTPRSLVGRTVDLADGSSSTVFRETAVPSHRPTEPVVLVVRFRLRWVHRIGWMHRVFRTTCVVNTPLFAGFPGFVSKLWMYDEGTGVYRGLYQWDGADRARAYAERLRLVLLPVCIPTSIRYEITPDAWRSDVLDPQ